MTENRIKKAEKNFVSSTIFNVINLLTTFALRTLFIYFLGIEYLGVNGLFANILGMLSLAELGVSSAIAFSLYKPLAGGNKDKIRQLVRFYKKAYRVIALIIMALGLALIPFLHLIVNGVENVSDLYLIYILFLANTVFTYFISYKSILVTADQKEYIVNNTNTIAKVITTILQSIILVVFRNYILFLIIELAVSVLSKLYINHQVNKTYPYINDKDKVELPQDEKKTIFRKIRALFLHKIGEVSIYQTDNILTSILINTETVGLVSNFTLIISNVNKFIVSFFNSAVAGLGNVIAVDSVEKRLKVAKRYDFISYCFYSWSATCLYFLLGPFISLWIGSDKMIDYGTICLLCVNFYMTGMRVALTNVRNAAGIFEKDKWVSIIQAVTNIAISIILAINLGLVGIYLGTFISGLIPSIIRPYKVYKYVFMTSSRQYFLEYIKRIVLLSVAVIGLQLAFSVIPFSSAIVEIIAKLTTVSIVIPLMIVAFYHGRDEFCFTKGLILGKIKKEK
ncbi:teichoic acid transporter [Candidatus Saccharibacteria bacterium]|nr:teichoic acid transporter [Candidatus Saccharibacteria bacterium]